MPSWNHRPTGCFCSHTNKQTHRRETLAPFCGWTIVPRTYLHSIAIALAPCHRRSTQLRTDCHPRGADEVGMVCEAPRGAGCLLLSRCWDALQHLAMDSKQLDAAGFKKAGCNRPRQFFGSSHHCVQARTLRTMVRDAKNPPRGVHMAGGVPPSHSQ